MNKIAPGQTQDPRNLALATLSGKSFMNAQPFIGHSVYADMGRKAGLKTILFCVLVLELVYLAKGRAFISQPDLGQNHRVRNYVHSPIQHLIEFADLCGCAILGRNNSRCGISLDNAIINNLRVLENAKDSWALEHRKCVGDLPKESDVAPYCKGDSIPCSIVGETYNINSLGTPASAKIPVRMGRYLAGSIMTAP
jgi:hypothetical protein